MLAGVIVLVIGMSAGTALAPAPWTQARAAAEPDTFRLDPSHTYIGFAVRHLAIATVRGEFKEVSSLLLFDRDDLSRSKVEVRIKAASVFTGNERRDTDLRENFLDVANHPEIVFISRRIERTPNGFNAIGDLTLHGTTRPLVLPFEFTGPVQAPGNLLRIGVSAETKIDRRDFGLALQRMADNALVVGNEVRIAIDVEFGRRVPAAPQPAGGSKD